MIAERKKAEKNIYSSGFIRNADVYKVDFKITRRFSSNFCGLLRKPELYFGLSIM